MLFEKPFNPSNMSLLPAEVHGALAQLLQALSSGDNQIRSQAEEQLNNDWVQARPEMLLMGLVEQIQRAEEPSVRKPQPRQSAEVEDHGWKTLTRVTRS